MNVIRPSTYKVSSSVSAAHKRSIVETDMSRPVIMSMSFHVLIVLVGFLGKPYLLPDPVVYDKPITVEILDMDELTQTDRQSMTAPKPDTKTKSMTPPKPAFSKPEKIKTIKETPIVPPIKDLKKPKPPALTDEVAEIKEPIDMDPIPSMETKPEEDKDETKEEEKKDKTEQLDNILVQLLEENADAPSSSEDPDAEITDEAQPQPSPDIQRITNALTISEQDALRQQISQCWNVMAGAKNAEELVVYLKLKMNPDRTVRDAAITDQSRYNRDSFFRAAADSALRAIRNPKCIPLRLPPDKYDQWSTITVRFDPKDMF